MSTSIWFQTKSSDRADASSYYRENLSPSERTPLFHSFVLLAQLYDLGSTDRWCCQSAKPQIVCLCSLVFYMSVSFHAQLLSSSRGIMQEGLPNYEILFATNKNNDIQPLAGTICATDHETCHPVSLFSWVPTTLWLPTCRTTCYPAPARLSCQ
jgi:hypothetical protein